MNAFDPSAGASPDSGLFGLDTTPADSGVTVVPVPFEATTSYRRGTAAGPEAILRASHQVDLFDVEVGKPYEDGICMLAPDEQILRNDRLASELARPILAVAGKVAGDAKLQADLERVNNLCSEVDQQVERLVAEQIANDKLVAVLGGDHSVAFGSIVAHAQRYPGMGILHLDAHADLRRAYEGFTRSHASVLYNVMEEVDGIEKLVQFGIRDLCEEEFDYIRSSGGRIETSFDVEIAKARFRGIPWDTEVQRLLSHLPLDVYLTFDIDGLDPAFCPNTGTPVPGGLSFQEVNYLLMCLVQSGRRIVGLDLVEVAPGNDEWDANVGARLLYKMIGWALKSRS